MKDRFSTWKAPKIRDGKFTRWLWVVFKPKKFVLGKYTDIGCFTAIFAHNGIEIGDEVQIGSHCSLYSLNTIDGMIGKVTIGKGACIGSHSTVLPGVSIGEGAIIGAHSLVKSNIPAHALAYGVPARVVKRGLHKKT